LFKNVFDHFDWLLSMNWRLSDASAIR